MKVYYYEACGWPNDEPEFLKFCENLKMNYFVVIIEALLLFFLSLALEKKFCKREKF
jgi:hypothetical protein